MTKLQLAAAAFLFAFFSSCNLIPSPALAFSRKAPAPLVSGPSPSSMPSASPAPPSYPRISIGTITGASSSEVQMVLKGGQLVNQVLSTPCFKDHVLGGSYSENQGLTPAQIWAKLSSTPVTVAVDFYTGSWYANTIEKTIGYEDVPGVVHMNRHFVSTAYMVGDNLAHEGEGHSQGFTHFGVKVTSEPYRMNQFFEACAPAAGTLQ